MTNWQDSRLGHRRVCHVSHEVDSPQAISRLVLSAARSGQLRELDLAHYWHPNVLFPSNPYTISTSNNSVNADGDDADEDRLDGVNERGLAVFAHPLTLRVFAKLISLRLLRCGLDDTALKVIAANSEQLRCMDISTNTKITDMGLNYLVPLAKVLKDLRLRQNYRLTDDGIRAALVNFSAMEILDIRCGVKRLRGRTHGQGNNGEDQNQRQIKIVSVTSADTLLALNAACPELKLIRIIAVDDQNRLVTTIPSFMAGKVDNDSKDGMDIDEWGEADDFYEGWTEFPTST
jgi:hypothetical protein